MLRSYRGIILAIVGGLTLAGGAIAQNVAKVTAGGQEIQASADRSAEHKQGNAAQAIAPADVEHREQAIQPECGTPQECRTEQRNQDDLIAQQAMAEAASSQRNATWWQTGIGAAGVILLILTVIYTHLATRAAIGSVKTLIAVERARVTGALDGVLRTRDGKIGIFSLHLINKGRSAGVLRESSIVISQTGLYKDFKPEDKQKHNILIETADWVEYRKFEFDLKSDEAKFIVGYYKFSTIFSSKLVTDYFCYEIGAIPNVRKLAAARKAAAAAAEEAAAAAAVAEGKPPPAAKPKVIANPLIPVPVVYRTDLDWPPDED